MGLELQDPKDMVTFFAKDIVWSEHIEGMEPLIGLPKSRQKEFPTLLKGRK